MALRVNGRASSFWEIYGPGKPTIQKILNL